MERTKRFWKTWELALLIALCLSCLSGVWAQAAQREIAGQMVRLHVLAVDDSPEEQAVKLRVRDAVLAYLAPELEGVQEKTEAMERLTACQNGIRQAAETAAEGRPVTVTLSEEYYPTRVYDGFSLPAGRYTSLRVVLGQGEGQNWWCVVYPPLCITAAQASAQAIETLSADTARIITEEDGYEIRFKILEFWGELTEKLDAGRAN